uniref:Cytochrome c oxidase subunit 3 n=1 Tax=Elateroidea sp. 2 KM-2017 TaxID=2219425 RepID=A0A346RG85_9COLE|nr:cytochrome c oxidase subunit 3 [Elateroidea sp. 2 KM-2017]
MKKNNTFHLVTPSPWPLISSLSAFSLTLGIINMINNSNMMLLILSMVMLMLISLLWWRDIIRESTFQGFHSLKTAMNMRMGMILFIISEIFLFFSIFWSFFHNSLSPNIELGLNWPPKQIISFNTLQVPLLNTMILLTSSITVSWSHYSLINNNSIQSLKSLMITIIMGMYFTILQGFEYYTAKFSMADSIYGSTFFLTTGFHGMHVIIGNSFLMICLMRMKKNHFSSIHNIGFESAIWYWHFVDAIWLFVYLSIYWWSK